MSLSTWPEIVTVSELALPRLTSPFAFNTPARSRLPATSVLEFRLMSPLPFATMLILPSEF